LAAVSDQDLLIFDKEKWNELLGPICQLWNTIFKIETFKQFKITQADLNTPDPVDQFVYMEMMNVREILGKVNASIQMIIRVLQGQEMLTP